MMKKRMIALLLAGLMATAALTSCRVQTNDNDNPGGTEPNQNNNQTTTTKPEDIYNPPVETWKEETKNVYTVKDVTLLQEASKSSTSLGTIPKETKLTSTKHNSSWYYVEYDGKQGYVAIKTNSTTNVTEIDIFGTDFEDIEGGSKIMYSNSDNTNVRLYPSTESFSTVKGGYKCNDEVTVVATNGIWFKVKFIDKDNVENFYFVHNTCLSSEKYSDRNNPDTYLPNFTYVNGDEGITMYVSVDKVNFRKGASTGTDIAVIMSLSKDCVVTVLATGVYEGRNWSYVKVAVPDNLETGIPAHDEEGFISSDCLSSSSTSGTQTLDDLLAANSGYTKIDAKTMYVLKGVTLNVRSTPSSSADGENRIDTIGSLDEKAPVTSVKVVAMGSKWCIIEHTMKVNNEDKTLFGFVHLDYLTSSSSGEKFESLEDLLDRYSSFGFVVCDPARSITAKGKVKCYANPEPQNYQTDSVGELAKDTQVILVAEQTGDNAKWCIIQKTENGPYYFVAISFFN